jgi:hypothetical protein
MKQYLLLKIIIALIVLENYELLRLSQINPKLTNSSQVENDIKLSNFTYPNKNQTLEGAEESADDNKNITSNILVNTEKAKIIEEQDLRDEAKNKHDDVTNQQSSLTKSLSNPDSSSPHVNISNQAVVKYINAININEQHNSQYQKVDTSPKYVFVSNIDNNFNKDNYVTPTIQQPPQGNQYSAIDIYRTYDLEKPKSFYTIPPVSTSKNYFPQNQAPNNSYIMPQQIAVNNYSPNGTPTQYTPYYNNQIPLSQYNAIRQPSTPILNNFTQTQKYNSINSYNVQPQDNKNSIKILKNNRVIDITLSTDPIKALNMVPI